MTPLKIELINCILTDKLFGDLYHIWRLAKYFTFTLSSTHYLEYLPGISTDLDRTNILYWRHNFLIMVSSLGKTRICEGCQIQVENLHLHIPSHGYQYSSYIQVTMSYAQINKDILGLKYDILDNNYSI